MNTRMLSVLMWKHGVVRLRRFILTALECLAPVIFFMLLFLIKDKIKPIIPKGRLEADSVGNTEQLPLLRHSEELRMIMYHPDTKFTAQLMDEVGQQLQIPRLAYYPSFIMSGYLPYTSESQLTSFVSSMEHTEAIVIFEKMEEDTMPSKLNYTIRMKRSFSTEGYKPTDETPGPHKGFGLNYELFMKLQWAVDTSYVKLRTGEVINQTIFLREFPYYNTQKSAIMKLICSLAEAICWLSLLLPFVFLTGRLIDERISGIQELMKMVGVSIKVLGLSHFLNALPAGLIFSAGGTIFLKASSNPIIPNSNGFLIFLMLSLYYNVIVALAFACSYITKTNQYATTLSVIAHVLLWLPAFLLSSYKVPYIVTLLTGFLPHVPMYWFWKEVSILEVYGSGVNFSTIMSRNYDNNCSVILACFFMIIQAALLYLLAWYLSLVRPGKYGTALPWNFPMKMLYKRKQEKLTVESETCDDVALHPMKKYWNKNEVIPKPAIDEEVFETNDGHYFEPPPNNKEVGIKIENVSKVYPKQVALKNVSLEVYKGEITVLLGHNGAGKTTLMSIITGMTSASGGSVLVHGADTVRQRAEVRRHLGLCPQHNLFFPDLTVHEHVMFFTMLKKGTFGEARQTSKKLIDQLGISDKLSSLVSQLSGGMKRRVQLACALAGDADTLILDEPTSGLDVETRRGLWDLLQSLRGERTVLLTTHFMEEADALGDRVAALHLGTLRCFATTMHLKKAVGTGYRLSFTTIGVPKESAISTVVTSHVSDAIVKETSINSISYNLPSHASDKFPQLFADLEAKRSKLGIDSIGVGVSTLEEVFLKLCSDVDTSISEDEVDSAPTSDPTTKRVTGVLLYLRQIKVLLKRQIKYAYSRKFIFLLLQILIPLAMIFVFTKQMNGQQASFSESMSLNLDVYAGQSDRRVLYNVNVSDVSMKIFKDQYPDVTFQETTDVADKVLRIGMDDVLEYNKYLVGVEVNENNATALYTTTVRHAAPVALNMLSNLLASRYIPSADARTITTNNQPFKTDYQLEKNPVQPKDFFTSMLWAILIIFIVLSTNINSISLPCKERESGSRHIHIMSGCPPELYWGSTLLFHTVLCTITLILPTALAAVLLDQDKTIDQPAFIGAFALILIVGAMAFFAFMYLLSFYFTEHTTNTLLVACIVVFGIFTPLVKTMNDLYETTSTVSTILVIFEYIMPTHTLVTSAVKCVGVARLNTWCTILYSACNTTNIDVYNEPAFDSKKCCAGIDHCYFCSDDYSPAYGLFILIAQFLIYMTMVTLTQRGMFNGLTDSVMNLRYSSSEPDSTDDMVRAEKTYVSKAIDIPPKQISDSMLVNDVHKTYVPFFRRKVNAVKGVSFSVKKGECFGLLGVNGAGKSTIFKMLTAEECPTRGRIFGNGYLLRRGNSEYLQTLGYCPQFFGLDMFQTGEDNLAMILTLRGLDEGWVKKEVKSWLDIIGLGKYASRVVSGYSGGCVRRLGAAAALCGGAATVLLDEPTTGVDVTARRRLWAAIRRAQARHRAVLITSHSMDEMEALCSRIAIMSGGSVCALGAAPALRAAHAQGHAVVFKVQHVEAEDEVDGSKSKIHLLKSKLHESFDCTLKDEHQTMLHYHINETMRYSELFSQLEALKQQFPNLIEDYSVTETTLEEVFLSFAKEQHEPV